MALIETESLMDGEIEIAAACLGEFVGLRGRFGGFFGGGAGHGVGGVWFGF